jgi:hypothetical protein
VHRTRLFVQHLPSFGWEPVVLTVHEKYYEEELDTNLERILPVGLKIEKVAAFPVFRPRLIGDIGLRAFFQLYRRAKKIIETQQIDFLYIPIPSFYVALLGRWLHNNTGIDYGIDYIDPWVHEFPGSDKTFSRHWFSTRIAKLLEPIAVKNASLITGVAEAYYKAVIERNPHLSSTSISGSMPYGGEALDHERIKEMNISPYLFLKKANKIQLVYAGAMLPKAYEPLQALFEAIAGNKELFANLEIHFIGTGKTPNDPQGYNIKSLAEQFGLWQQVVFEYPRRIPYLDVLVHLNAADGIFILGSTEPHYTPSKVFQAVLSHKPVLAVLHHASTALHVINKTGAGICINIDPLNLKAITIDFPEMYKKYQKMLMNFDPKAVNLIEFESYSARSVTKQLVHLFNQAIQIQK